MKKYHVIKYFGYFDQTWEISAESEEEAWNNAEKGRLLYQGCRNEKYDSKGYVIDLSKSSAKTTISTDEYYSRMAEAVELGMHLDDIYQEKLDAWIASKANK